VLKQTALVQGFSFSNLTVTTTHTFIIGGSYEKWKKETRLDVCTGSRTQDNGAQEVARIEDCQVKRSEGATRQKAFSIGLSLDTRA
jgi:hypothetical protein